MFDFQPLSTSNIIELLGIFASLISSIIAIIISVKTLRQNSVMIEESSRAIIGIYGSSINTSSPTFYIVVRNFGNSLANITKFESDFDFSDCYGNIHTRDYLLDLSHCVIAPNQSKICKLDYNKITRPIKFHVEYISAGKKYSETTTVDLKAGCDMLTSKSATTGNELHAISYTLQEMLQKNL